MTTTRVTRSLSPVPALSRGTSPSGFSPPSTPTLPSAFPSSFKAPPQRVEFASNVVSSSYRRAEWDELSVMREFATHASHCRRCNDPLRAVREREPLCRSGTEYAKDIGKYFFSYNGKPFSTIDRKRREHVQVEVPVEYAVVKELFEALSKGLKFTSLKQKRPEIHHARTSPARAPTSTEEAYDLRPSRTTSRRNRSSTYTGYTTTPHVETRSPDDDLYRPRESRGSLFPEERQSRRRTVVYPVTFR